MEYELAIEWKRGIFFRARPHVIKYIETMPTGDEAHDGTIIAYPQSMIDEYEERTARAWASLSERNLQRSNPLRFSGKRIINE